MADKLNLKYVPTTPTAAESPKEADQPSGLRQAGAAVIRTGAPWLASEGGLIGAGVNGTAELIAELLEGSKPNLGRIMLEGGLGAIPGSAMIKAGHAGISALKGAGIAELGNVGRRYTEKGNIADAYRPITEAMKGNFGELGMDLGTSALGAGVGAIGGHYSTAPEPKAPPIPPSAGEKAAQTAEERMAEFNKLPRKEKDRLLKERANADRVEAEAAKAQQDAEAAAKKATEDEAARLKFEKEKAGRVASTTVSETTTAPDVNAAGGKGQVRTSFRVAKPKKGGAPRVNASPQGPAPVEPTSMDLSNVVDGEIIPSTPERLALPPDSRVPGGPEADATRAARVDAAVNAAPPLSPELDVPAPAGSPTFDAEGKVVTPVSSEPLPSSASVSPAAEAIAPVEPAVPVVPEPVVPPVDPAVQAAVDEAQMSLGGGKAPKGSKVDPVQSWKDKLATILKMTGEAPPTTEPKTPVLTEAVKGREAPVSVPEPVATVEPPVAPVASPAVEPTLPPEVMPEPPLTGVGGPGEGTPSNIPFRSSKTMATDLYRDLRAAQKEGTLPEVPGVPREKQPVRLAGRAAQGQPGTERRGPDVGPVDGGLRATDIPEPTIPSVTERPLPPPPKGVAQTASARTASQSPEVRARAAATRVANNLKRKGGSEKGEIDPALMFKILLGGGGALAGAAVNPDDPLTGAMVGGGLGLGAGHLGSKMLNPGGEEALNKFFEKVPNFSRFSYLSGPSNIAANALAGPVGSGTMGSLEQILAERLGAPKGTRDAAGAFGEVANPINFWNKFVDAQGRAGQILRNAQNTERAGGTFTSKPIDWSNPKSIAAHGLEIPATAMAAGDEAVRGILVKHGFSEDEARRITLTSEPLWRVTKGLVNFSRTGGPIGAMMLPFARTAANILEQGAERTPVIGFAAQLLKDPKFRDIWQKQVAQQGLGAATWLVAEQLGESMDPETAKGMRKFVSNLGGQYSLAATAGFTMGQSARAGKTNASDFLKSAIGSFTGDVPLPSTQVFTDYGTAIGNTMDTGALQLPNALNPGVLRDRGIPGVISGPSIEDILFGRNLSEKP